MVKTKDSSNDLKSLVAEYLNWQNKKETAEKQLEALKVKIVLLAKEKKIKKIAADGRQLLIVSQSETRFPQIGESGRKELEKIVRESGEVQEVMVFDIITLGNLFDRKKLSPQLIEKLQPFAKKIQATKIVIRPFSKTSQKT